MKYLKLFFVAAFLFLLTTNLFATAQYPDKIIYNGKEHNLHSNPLEEYFQKFPDRKPKDSVMSSALWRGYVATFEISENALFLKDVQIQVAKKTKNNSFDMEWKSVLSEVVPEDKKLKVDWFSGLLVLPFGKVVKYVHMGYASTFENYTLLEIETGDFKRSKEFGYKEYEDFKQKQFEAFKKTAEYQTAVKELRKDGATQEFIDSFLRGYITNYTSKILVD